MERRELTEVERLNFTAQLATLRRQSGLRSINWTAFALWLAAANGLTLFFWIVTLRVTHLVPASVALWSVPFTRQGAQILLPFASALCLFVLLAPIWFAELRRCQLIYGLRRDLHQGLVNEHQHRIIDVKRLRDPDFGGRYYLLNLGPGRILCLDAPLTQNADRKPTTAHLRRQLKVTRLPRSGAMQVSFSGAPIANLPRYQEVTSRALPALRPGDWLDLPWDQIENHFCLDA